MIFPSRPYTFTFIISRLTAQREVEEELGIALPEGSLSAEPLFCIAAEQAPIGGCNCFEDVYVCFLPGASKVPPTERFHIGAAEVAGLKWVTVRELREALSGTQSGGSALPAADLVPRTADYQKAFFAELERRPERDCLSN